MNKQFKRITKNILGGVLTILILLCVFFAILNLSFNYLYIKTNVRGFSMQPTININMTDAEEEGDAIYINPYSNIKTDDIVVAKVSWYKNYIIKRVVGTPGDIIEIRDLGKNYGVFTNEKLLYTKEKYDVTAHGNSGGSNQYYLNYLSYLDKAENANNVTTNSKGDKCIKLNDKEYFVMGDNWGETLDSTLKGPIKEKEIVGKVELIIDVENDDPFVATKHFLKKLFSIN